MRACRDSGSGSVNGTGLERTEISYKNRVILSKREKLKEQNRQNGEVSYRPAKQGAKIQKRESWIENPVFFIVIESAAGAGIFCPESLSRARKGS